MQILLVPLMVCFSVSSLVAGINKFYLITQQNVKYILVPLLVTLHMGVKLPVKFQLTIPLITYLKAAFILFVISYWTFIQHCFSEYLLSQLHPPFLCISSSFCYTQRVTIFICILLEQAQVKNSVDCFMYLPCT